MVRTKISKDLYKERPAVKRSDGKTEFLFLSKDGTKLVSFRTKEGKELFVQNPSENYN